MKNIAVVLAGGSGKRLGNILPKQFMKIAGKMVIEHTIEMFQKHSKIDEIAIICNADYIFIMEQSVNSNNYTKVKKILNGGLERYHSSLTAIKAYDDGVEKKLIFHDAVRPLVSERIITDCIEALENYSAVDVAIPATDTIIKVNLDAKIIDSIPERKYFYKGQTPQAFRFSTIKKAYDLAIKDVNLQVTDDCGVVKFYLPETPIYVIDGEGYNMKLTHKEDSFLLDKLFQLKSTELNDGLEPIDYTNLMSKVIVVFGGSYGIGSEICRICNANNIKVYAFSRSETNTNIGDKNAVISALEKVIAKEDRIDYVINTAGVLQKEPLVSMDYSSIQESINTNYLGSVIIAKESFKYLSKSKGSLLFFTSSSYTRGRAFYSLYSSLKAATVNFVQAIGEEWGESGINVNCINPERTDTPMRTKNFGEEPKSTLLEAKDVASIALKTLLLDITGQVIDVKLTK